MRVFSTFSGISAATAAWKPLGWTFVGYAEVNPYACAVLAARCGATRPKSIPYAENAYLADESYALIARLGALGANDDDLIRRYDTKFDIDKTDERHRHEVVADLLHADFVKQAGKELENRKELLSLHRNSRYEANGTVPNFGDIWSITDDDLEELGPIDLLEGGSPCQAFSAAGQKNGLIDFRSALMLGYLDLVQRMRRINGLQWIIWENVRNVLSDKGNGFGHLLGRLVLEGGRAIGHDGIRYDNAGYVSGPDGSVAWRVLNTERFGRPQRRERVFALGHVGMGSPRRDPREILFDEEGEGFLVAPQKKPPEEIALSLSGRRIGEVPRPERLVTYMTGQGDQAYSIAESRTISPALRSAPSGSNSVPRVAYAVPDEAGKPNYIVRKMLPVEAERLQGFPDGWTAVEVNGQMLPDEDRHACIGNSMTVDVMRWLGGRLDRATQEERARDVRVAPAEPSCTSSEGGQVQSISLPPVRRRFYAESGQ